jgi:hypothetical protein
MLDLTIGLMAENINLGYCERCQRKISNSPCVIWGNPVDLRWIDEKYIFNEIGSVLKLKEPIGLRVTLS